MIFDGVDPIAGGTDCSNLIWTYSYRIDQRLEATGSDSPVRITGEMTVNGNLARVTAHFELVDPGYSFTAHQATLYVYEDSVHWCCGLGNVDRWEKVVRMVRSTPTTLTTLGEVKTVTQTLNLSGFHVPVDPTRIHPAAIFEETGGSRTVIQASDFVAPDFELRCPIRVASLPGGNGDGTFSGRIANLAETADVIHLSLDEGFGWPAAFQVEGDPAWYQNFDLALGAGEEKALTVRVTTDATRRIGIGNITAQSQGTGRVTAAALRLYNASYSILLVDADGGGPYEAPFADALASRGWPFETVPGAGLDALRGYDCVIWQTGYETPGITQTEKDNLCVYLDEGGSLFLSSMDILTGAIEPDVFVGSYLGVAGWTCDTGADRAVGTNGDPISDGMDMPLTWPTPEQNRVDRIVPAQGAAVIFTSETGNVAALRYQATDFRTVFNTVCQDAFPQTGQDPNNTRTVILKTVDWLLEYDPAGVAPTPGGAPRLVLQSGPNPARGFSELRFSLDATNTRFALLTFLDAGGRVVRSIRSASLKPGLQRANWDCTDESGRPVPAGLYFARLQTAEGCATAKIVVVQ